MLRLLEKTGAKGSAVGVAPAQRTAPPLNVRAAVSQSVALMQRSSTEFFNQSGCVSCHSQNATAMAVSKARAAGIAVDQKASLEQTKATAVLAGLLQQPLLQLIDPPGSIDTIAFTGLGLEAEGAPAGETTDSIASYLAISQHSAGNWHPVITHSRAPVEERDIGRTGSCGTRVAGLFLARPPSGVRSASGTRAQLAAEVRAQNQL
jgi:hypothetical protein